MPYNKEIQKRSDDKRKDCLIRKEQLRLQALKPESIKRRVIRDWKKRGVVTNNYDKLYDDYLITNTCQRCENIMEGKGQNKKCLYYCNEFLIFVCNSCNWRLNRINIIMNNKK